MARPLKYRRIDRMPSNRYFGPLNSTNTTIIGMTVDEYECIRLIDHERMTQEECATQMNIARTTVQSIYASARKKIADSLVNGGRLFIDGGNYEICPGIGRGLGLGLGRRGGGRGRNR